VDPAEISTRIPLKLARGSRKN